jgi:pyrroloquinoline quinone biosynthesis protein D
VIELDTRVRLARKVRLRRDPRSNKMMLLYPERGLELGDTAADVAALCDGRTAAAIVGELCARYAGVARAEVEQDVLAFLRTLAERGLLAGDEEAP